MPQTTVREQLQEVPQLRHVEVLREVPRPEVQRVEKQAGSSWGPWASKITRCLDTKSHESYVLNHFNPKVFDPKQYILEDGHFLFEKCLDQVEVPTIQLQERLVDVPCVELREEPSEAKPKEDLTEFFG